MEFRQANILDLESLLPLCKQHFDKAGMSERGYTYDEHSARVTLSQWLRDTQIFVGICEGRKGVPKGIIAFVKAISPFNHSDQYWGELLWYAEKAIAMREIFDYFVKISSGDTVRVGTPVKASLTRFHNDGVYFDRNEFLRHNK